MAEDSERDLSIISINLYRHAALSGWEGSWNTARAREFAGGGSPREEMEESGRQMREVEKWQTLRGRTAASNRIRQKRKRDRESGEAEKRPSNWGKERPSAKRSRGYSKLYMAEKRAACIQVSHFTPFMTVWMSSQWPSANPAPIQKSSGQTEGAVHVRKNTQANIRAQERDVLEGAWFKCLMLETLLGSVSNRVWGRPERLGGKPRKKGTVKTRRGGLRDTLPKKCSQSADFALKIIKAKTIKKLDDKQKLPLNAVLRNAPQEAERQSELEMHSV